MRAQLIWTENIDVVAVTAAEVVAAGATFETDEIDFAALGIAEGILQVKAVYGGAADADTLIGPLLACDGQIVTDDKVGVLFDTQRFEEKTITHGAGATKVASMKVSGVPRFKFQIDNSSSSDSVTVSIKLARYVWEN